MDRDSNHYQVASDPLEIAYNFRAECDGQHSALETLEREFADSPEALATNTLILLGLAARASQHIEMHGEDAYTLLNEQSQRVYISLLERLVHAGSEIASEPEKNTIFTGLFERLELAAAKPRPWADVDLPPYELRQMFTNELQQALELKRSFHYHRIKLEQSERNFLSDIRELINTVSDDYFIEITRTRANQLMPVETEGFNLELLEKFCEPTYWERLEDLLLVDREIGRPGRTQRLQNIGITYLRWVRVQAEYVAYVRLMSLTEADQNSS